MVAEEKAGDFNNNFSKSPHKFNLSKSSHNYNSLRLWGDVDHSRSKMHYTSLIIIHDPGMVVCNSLSNIKRNSGREPRSKI